MGVQPATRNLFQQNVPSGVDSKNEQVITMTMDEHMSDAMNTSFDGKAEIARAALSQDALTQHQNHTDGIASSEQAVLNDETKNDTISKVSLVSN